MNQDGGPWKDKTLLRGGKHKHRSTDRNRTTKHDTQSTHYTLNTVTHSTLTQSMHLHDQHKYTLDTRHTYTLTLTH